MKKIWVPPLSAGACPTGKVRYESEEIARGELKKVFEARVRNPTDQPPERDAHSCEHCNGWHLTSRPPEPPEELGPKGTDETWEKYAHRLERRIKEQRDYINRVTELRADAGNRAERKRLDQATAMIGRMELRMERLKIAHDSVIEELRRREEKKRVLKEKTEMARRRSEREPDNQVIRGIALGFRNALDIMDGKERDGREQTSI